MDGRAAEHHIFLMQHELDQRWSAGWNLSISNQILRERNAVQQAR